MGTTKTIMIILQLTFIVVAGLIILDALKENSSEEVKEIIESGERGIISFHTYFLIAIGIIGTILYLSGFFDKIERV